MITGSATNPGSDLVASLLQWWTLAGVDIAVGEEPCGWLSRDRATALPQSPMGQPIMPPPPILSPAALRKPEVEEAPPPPVVMPDDLGAFLDWLASDSPQPEDQFSRSRILPRVPAGADILVITDMPTADDMGTGRLFSGPAQGLLAAMFRAIGRDVEQAAVASLLMARPSGGIIEDSLAGKAAERLSYFIGLLNIRDIILFGDGTNRALQQMNGNISDASSLSVNHGTGKISAMLLPAPFVLLKHAERKAAAWAQLRQLATRP